MKRHSDRDGHDSAKRSRGDKGDKGGGKHTASKGAGKGGNRISTAGLGVIKRYGFKVLCADRLAAKLIGKNGDTRAQLQEETGANVWISKRDEVFPNPKFRLLILHADEPGQIMDALEKVVPHLVAVGEQLRDLGEPDTQLLGKEEGEYVFHVALPSIIKGKLIGKGGVNIQELRETTKAKVFFENNDFNGHHATRIIGTPEQICHVLQLVNDFVQEAADTDEFRLWIASAPDAAPGGAAPSGQDSRHSRDNRDLCGDHKIGKCTRGDSCRFSHEGGRGFDEDRRPERGRERERDRDTRRDRDRDRSGHQDRPRSRDNRSPPGRGESWQQQDQEHNELPGLLGDPRFTSPVDIPDGLPLEVMGSLAQTLPAAATQAQHAISCQLSTDHLNEIMDDDSWRFIEDRTSASVELKEAGSDENGPFTSITITGELLSTYFAHFLLMQRVHEASAAKEEMERQAAEAAAAEAAEAARAAAEQQAARGRRGSEAARDGEDARVADLKAQVAALQSQLQTVQGGSGGNRRGGNNGRR